MIEVPHFTRPKALLYPAAQVYEWETTLIVAPYPDHQWLGCAGAIALLRQMGYRVRVLFLGGSPNSSPLDTWASGAPSSLVAAMTYLRVCEQAITNLQLRPQRFPRPGTPGFEEATRQMIDELESLNPDSLVIPLLDDESPDLLATRQIVDEARRQFELPLKVIEYPLLNAQALPSPVTKPTNEYDVWRLDIREVMDDKAAALQELRSQNTTQVPSPEHLPVWETYLEYRG